MGKVKIDWVQTIGVLVAGVIVGYLITSMYLKPSDQLDCPPPGDGTDCSWYESRITQLEQNVQTMTDSKNCYRTGWINERQAAFNILKDGCYSYEQCNAVVSAVWSIFGGTSSSMQNCGG